jgi:hypothetical protein
MQVTTPSRDLDRYKAYSARRPSRTWPVILWPDSCCGRSASRPKLRPGHLAIQELAAQGTKELQLGRHQRLLSAARLPGLRARWMDAISVSPEDVILNARREAAVVSAELKVLAALRDAYQGGEMTWAQLRDAYRVLSAARLPGLRARWMDAVPVSPENVILNARREPAGAAGGVWCGHSPLHRGEYYPPIGQRVVYVLFDAGRHAVYVRTTNRCSQRFAGHRAQGKRWSSWTAYAVDSAEAYEVQARFMRRYQTDLNRQWARA